MRKKKVIAEVQYNSSISGLAEVNRIWKVIIIPDK